MVLWIMNQESILLIFDEFAKTIFSRGQDRNSGSHGFQTGVAEGIIKGKEAF